MDLDFTQNEIDVLIAAREEDCRKVGISNEDIQTSRNTGIDPKDIGTFKHIAKELELIIVVRCPKLNSRAFHGYFPPKPMRVTAKTNDLGFVVDEKGRPFVSDYDLMSIYLKKRDWSKAEKIFVSARNGLARGSMSPLARKILRQLNQRLVSRIQHGCQDDFHSVHNPGVNPNDFFAGFWEGKSIYLPNSERCAYFYRRQEGMVWAYDSSGRYIANRRNQRIRKGRKF